MPIADTKHGEISKMEESDIRLLYLDLWGVSISNPDKKEYLFYAGLVRVIDASFYGEPKEDETSLTIELISHTHIGPTYHDVVRELLGGELYETAYATETEQQLTDSQVDAIVAKLKAGLQYS